MERERKRERERNKKRKKGQRKRTRERGGREIGRAKVSTKHRDIDRQRERKQIERGINGGGAERRERKVVDEWINNKQINKKLTEGNQTQH